MDVYVAALASFHRVQSPFLAGLAPGDPEFKSVVEAKEAAHDTLLRVRREYWDHVESHKCRNRDGPESVELHRAIAGLRTEGKAQQR